MGIAFFAFAAAAPPAHGQVSSADRKCIDTINKETRKIAKAEGREIDSCLRFFAKGLLPGTAEACLTDDPNGRLDRTIQRSVKNAAKVCLAAPPIGAGDINLGVFGAVQTQVDIVHAVAGPNLNTDLETDSDGERCEQKVVKAVNKCADTRLNEFVKCKKKGLKDGTITDAASLADQCLGVGAAGQPDSKGKIARLCIDKVETQVQRRCDDQGLPLDLVFPGCGGATDTASVVACFDRAASCSVCNLWNTVDGLSRDCDLFDDGLSNLSCATTAICGDGVVEGIEVCDDGDTLDGNGCSALCQVEDGFTCLGEGAGSCTADCGDGLVRGAETCDDLGTVDGDGCDSSCQVESGYACTGEPSSCVTTCGDGFVAGVETCDDSGTADGDGCDSSCQVEPGFACTGEPSSCDGICGDGVILGTETCDDFGTVGGDGCDATCQTEPGYVCSGEPSSCNTVCGDSVVAGLETCDDGGTTGGDGCSAACQIEGGYQCTGSPSTCSEVCGDGQIVGGEQCDDSGTASGDGCSATCQFEPGFTCSGEPTSCSNICGDGLVVQGETCDDSGTSSGDGCSATCQTEIGYTCSGEPSSCDPICGDGLVRGAEACDDNGISDGDGCSSTCGVEPGFVCSGEPSSCNAFTVVIDSPAHGSFTQAGSVQLDGHITELPAAQASLTINGVPVVVQPNQTFSTNVNLSALDIFNPFRATVTDTSNGATAHDRIVVISGDSVNDGDLSIESVALRFNDSGLDAVEPLVAQLAGGGLDLAALLPVGTVLINNECFIDGGFVGCLGRATVKIKNPPPSISSFGLTMDSMVNFVAGFITVTDIAVNVRLDGTGLVPSCDIGITASAAFFDGDYALQPDPGDPSSIDVNQVGPLGVSFAGFNTSFGGICDVPIIGDIIQAFLPNVENLTINAMKDFLDDPDGGGPADSPIADAIEVALAGISISGPIGESLGVMLETPLFDVIEDNDGITLDADSRFTVEVGAGPGQCLPPVGAPDLLASFAVNEAFPPFGPTTPVGGTPYGLGLCISTDGFNQLLRAQTECGLLVSSISELDLGGGPVPLTTTVLGLLIPPYLSFPPGTPVRIDIRPTLAPIVTGEFGPSAEIAELKIAQVIADVVLDDGSEFVTLTGAFDARMGLELDFAPAGDAIEFVLSEPLAGDISVAILVNPIGANEAVLETSVLPPLVSLLLPDLASSLSTFPLPSFLGLQLDGLEVSRNGDFMSLFADLTPAP